MAKKAAKKVEAKPAAAPKKHERKVKPAETDRIEKGVSLAVDYLIQRDNMDPQLALDIVSTMDAESINALISEANTAVIEKTKSLPPPDVTPTPDAKIVISFVAVPALVGDERFAEQVNECARESIAKNTSETNYKAIKAELFDKLKSAVGINKVVECLGIKVEPYIGTTTWLDEQKLLEAGVAPELIKKGWKKKEFNDVRFTLPAEMKPKKEPK